MEISEIKRERVFLGPTSVVCHPSFQKICLRPYFNHVKGCPNYGKKLGCPPNVSFFLDIFEKEIFLAVIVFDFRSYLFQKRKEHPEWTERALKNLRHWQGHLRSELRKFIVGMDWRSCGDEVIFTPEAMGVNLTATCENFGLKLEWPPEKKVCEIAIIAKKK